jgi:hypothetical protein
MAPPEEKPESAKSAEAVPAAQLRQRGVHQVHLRPGVPVARVVAGGAVHARPPQQDHRRPARRGAQRRRRGAPGAGRRLVASAHAFQLRPPAREAEAHAGRVAGEVHQRRARRRSMPTSPRRPRSSVAQALMPAVAVAGPQPVRQRAAPRLARLGSGGQALAGGRVGGEAGRRRSCRPGRRRRGHRRGAPRPTAGAAAGGRGRGQQQQQRGRRERAAWDARHGHLPEGDGREPRCGAGGDGRQHRHLRPLGLA